MNRILTLIIFFIAVQLNGQNLIPNPGFEDYSNCPVFFPSAFSPNGDGINDMFSPFFDCDIEQFEWIIFDRWGRKIFETNGLNDFWGGTINGQPAPMGIFGYVLRYKSRKKSPLVNSESVTLIY